MDSSLPSEANNSWAERIRAAHERSVHRRNVIDDGFFSHMAANANLRNNLFEIPSIQGARDIQLPEEMIPFSQLGRSKNHDECICFFEKDPLFADAVLAADEFIESLRGFPLVLSPDCSLYRDMPLATQIANVYLSRLVGHYFEEKGLTVVPTIRWSDERSYTSELFGEPFAFAGAPRRTIVAVGTYGCIRGSENRRYFREGLAAMLDYLKPKTVLVYGSMPDPVFADLLSRANFKHYADWTTRQHGRN